MKCTSSRNSFCAVESTTDEKGEGTEQTEAETAASEEVSCPDNWALKGVEFWGVG